jgi:hypothetical protein
MKKNTSRVVNVAIKAEDIFEPGKMAQQGAAVQSPVPPGAVDGGQGGVGEDYQRGGWLQPGQDLAQPALLGFSQGKARAVRPILPDSVQAEKIDPLVSVKKAAIIEELPASPAFFRPAIAFAPHRQHRHGQIREDLLSQGQGLGVAVVGQVPGKKHQVRRGTESPDLRHRPGQRKGFGTPVVPVPQVGVGQASNYQVWGSDGFA